MFSLINILNCLPPLLAMYLVQERMYEINYIDRQKTKPRDKNSLNWPVGSGHSHLGLQIYFFIIPEKAEHIDYGFEIHHHTYYILLIFNNRVLLNSTYVVEVTLSKHYYMYVWMDGWMEGGWGVCE